MPPALRVHDLWKSYAAGVRGCSARVWVLRGCTLEVGVAERVAIVGARGSGKSTLLRCLAGERADAGRIEIFGAGVLLTDDERSRCDAVGPVQHPGAVVMVARNVAQVRGVVDRILLLQDGRLSALTRSVVRRVAESSPAPRPFR